MKVISAATGLALSLVFAPIDASAAVCASIDENDEYGSLSRGEVVYRDLGATLRLRIKSINQEAGEICGATEKGDACFDAGELFSADALAVCSAERNQALGTGVIFIYGQTDAGAEEDEGEED